MVDDKLPRAPPVKKLVQTTAISYDPRQGMNHPGTPTRILRRILGPSLRQAVTRLREAQVAGRLLEQNLDALHLAIGQVESRTVAASSYPSIQDAEFRVFSQFGEDGIIQYLVSKAGAGPRTFVEIGVGDYRESNTRFLLQQNGWEGLIIDSGSAHLDFLETPRIHWHSRVQGCSAFVTAGNVNQLVSQHGFDGEIGLLSLDIDGNDYWILKALEVIQPRVLVIEYNSSFGSEQAVVVPYDPKFDRIKAHPAGTYFGASLFAICHLAESRMYQFVGTDSAGVNAFFVRSDLGAALPRLTARAGWVGGQYRQPVDAKGRRTWADLQRTRLMVIADLPLYNTVDDTTLSVGEVFDLRESAHD